MKHIAVILLILFPILIYSQNLDGFELTDSSQFNNYGKTILVKKYEKTIDSICTYKIKTFQIEGLSNKNIQDSLNFLLSDLKFEEPLNCQFFYACETDEGTFYIGNRLEFIGFNLISFSNFYSEYVICAIYPQKMENFKTIDLETGKEIQIIKPLNVDDSNTKDFILKKDSITYNIIENLVIEEFEWDDNTKGKREFIFNGEFFLSGNEKQIKIGIRYFGESGYDSGPIKSNQTATIYLKDINGLINKEGRLKKY